LMCWS